MKEIIKYKAIDGKVFLNEYECVNYERKILSELVITVKDLDDFVFSFISKTNNFSEAYRHEVISFIISDLKNFCLSRKNKKKKNGKQG